MARFTKQQQENGSWRLFDALTGEPVGRVWSTAHCDRFIRDSDLAEAVAAALALSGAARRQAVRTAFQTWQTAGGHSVDFSNLTQSLNDDAGQASGNRYLYIAGANLGYFHSVIPQRDIRIGRWIRLAEEAFSAEALGTQTARNNALDAAVNRFRDDGALD